jgi:hypothetical protein
MRAVADGHSPRASPRDDQGHDARRGAPGGQLEGVVRGEKGKLACYMYSCRTLQLCSYYIATAEYMS